MAIAEALLLGPLTGNEIAAIAATARRSKAPCDIEAAAAQLRALDTAPVAEMIANAVGLD